MERKNALKCLYNLLSNINLVIDMEEESVKSTCSNSLTVFFISLKNALDWGLISPEEYLDFQKLGEILTCQL